MHGLTLTEAQTVVAKLGGEVVEAEGGRYVSLDGGSIARGLSGKVGRLDDAGRVVREGATVEAVLAAN